MRYASSMNILATKSNLLAGAALLAGCGYAHAQLPSTERSVDFEVCLKFIRDTAQSERQAPTNIVETADMRVVRFRDPSGGSILVTCSRLDQKLTITKSPRR